MNKMAQITALALGLALSPCGFAAAHPRLAPRRDIPDYASAMATCPTPDYEQLAREGRPVVPDFTVQYGCVLHPERASGSLGAMLRGENPTAGAIP